MSQAQVKTVKEDEDRDKHKSRNLELDDAIVIQCNWIPGWSTYPVILCCSSQIPLDALRSPVEHPSHVLLPWQHKTTHFYYLSSLIVKTTIVLVVAEVVVKVVSCTANKPHFHHFNFNNDDDLIKTWICVQTLQKVLTKNNNLILKCKIFNMLTTRV